MYVFSITSTTKVRQFSDICKYIVIFLTNTCSFYFFAF